MSDRRDSDRRLSQNRRAPQERRRTGEQRTVSVEVTPTNLRVLLTTTDAGGERPVVVALESPWRKESRTLLSPEGAAEFRETLKVLATQERFGAAPIRFSLTGNLAVTRVTSGPSSRVEKELAELRERSQLYLALGPGPKTISTCRLAIDARHELGMVSAANRQVVNALVDAAERAGLQVEAIESSLASLSRWVGAALPSEEPTILVQVEPEEIHLGVCHQGRLLLEYRSSTHFPPEETPQLLTNQYNRLLRFCNGRLGLQLKELRQVLVVGEPAAVGLARAAIAKQAQFKLVEPEISALELLGEARENLSPATFAAVAGLSLRPQRGGAIDAPNLMDERLAAARIPIRPMLIRSALPLAAVILLAISFGGFNRLKRSQLTRLETEIADLAAPVARARELSLIALRDTVKSKQIAQLAARVPTSRMLKTVQTVGGCLPEDVWLDLLRVNDSLEATLSGASYSESGMYDFVGYLEKAPRVQEIALQGTGEGQSPEGPTTSFDLRMQLASPALTPTQPSPTTGEPTNG